MRNKKADTKQKILKTTILSLLFVLPFFSIAQTNKTDSLKWRILQDGLYFCEYEIPEKSILNDSKLTLLKIDPTKYDFQLLSSSEHGKRNRSADEWADEFKMAVVVNAGMYSLSNGRTNKGYLKNYGHYNNSHLNGAYNVMMALNPKENSEPDFKLFDLTSQSWDSIHTQFHSFAQGMRMIDRFGNPMAWDKRPWQSCSMVVCGTDTYGNIIFAFTRSPYTHQSLINILLSLPLNIRTTVYLEGGPETSLYINTGDTIISKFGSYVSRTYENDDNDHFWKIPNVIGMKAKE